MTRLLLVPLLALSLAFAPGCNDDGKVNPFEGSWYAEDGVRITFTDRGWQDSVGNGGSYAYAGEYPDFNLALTSGAGSQTHSATFIDEDTVQICPALPAGTADCDTLIIDQPTLH